MTTDAEIAVETVMTMTTIERLHGRNLFGEGVHMSLRLAILGLVASVSTTAGAQSSNTSSNSSSNNGVVRERVVDTYCDNGFCSRSVERNVYRDGSNNRFSDDVRDFGSHSGGTERRFARWALRNFDYNRNGRLSRREYNDALRAWRSR